MTKNISTSQNKDNIDIKKNKLTPMAFFISFVLISGLIGFIIGGIIIGNSQ